MITEQVGELFDFLNLDAESLVKVGKKSTELHYFLKNIIISLVENKKLNTEDLEKFSGFVRQAYQEMELKYLNGTIIRNWDRNWDKGTASSKYSFSKLVRTTEDLLINLNYSRIKKCEGNECEILFFDQSKNCSRRWCEMKHCGMLLKSKRYYEKHRKKLG